MTAPTIGLGLTRPAPLPARERASSIYFSSDILLPPDCSIPRSRVERHIIRVFLQEKSSEHGCSELKFKQKSRNHDSKKLLLRILPSSIQTILSVPESHRFLRGCARGLYRRSGIAPCPEDIFRFYCYVLLLFMLLLQSRIVKRKIFLRGWSYPISNKAPA